MQKPPMNAKKAMWDHRTDQQTKQIIESRARDEHVFFGYEIIADKEEGTGSQMRDFTLFDLQIDRLTEWRCSRWTDRILESRESDAKFIVNNLNRKVSFGRFWRVRGRQFGKREFGMIWISYCPCPCPCLCPCPWKKDAVLSKFSNEDTVSSRHDRRPTASPILRPLPRDPTNGIFEGRIVGQTHCPTLMPKSKVPSRNLLFEKKQMMSSWI